MVLRILGHNEYNLGIKKQISQIPLYRSLSRTSRPIS